MIPRIKSLVLALALTLPIVSAAADEAQPYHFEKGPIAAKVTDRSTLQLPEGFLWLGSEDARRALEKMGNFPPPSLRGLITAPKANWFVVVSYIDSGYIKDDDAKDWDADDLLQSIKSGTDEDNAKRKAAGTPELGILGWAEKPHYDEATHKVVWAVRSRSSDEQEDGVNFNTLTLGRYGYISMNLVTALALLPANRPNADLLLANLSFDEGSRYSDFSSATDKVAAFGLAALIAGAAAKAGLLAKLWAFLLPVLLIGKKFIVLIVAAVGGGLWRLVTGRRKKSAPAGD